MTTKEIEKFFDRFERSKISELKIKDGDVELYLRKDTIAKEGAAGGAFGTAGGAFGTAGGAFGAAEDAEADDEVQSDAFSAEENKEVMYPSFETEGLTLVKSPIVGTFYVAASPQDEPYVKKGEEVKKGQPLGLIEAMKIMNEITSPCDGTVISVDAADGSFVGYDTCLITIKEKKDV